MRARRLFAAFACLSAATVAPATAALAAPSPSPTPVDPAPSNARSTIGGPAMAGTGLVLNKATGIPPIPAIVLAPSWIVADLDTGQVLAAKDPHGQYRPASTLKTLTSTSLLPSEPDSTVYTGTHAEQVIDGTRVGIEDGQKYTRQQILEGMMLSSGNDAAEALAAAYPGGRSAALATMNAFAHHIQADDTLALTPSGLDAVTKDGQPQVSSSYDLALIARQLLKDPVLAGVVAERKSTFPCTHGPSCKKGTFEIQNHNHVVTTLSDAIGIKSGGTSAAHIVVVGAINRAGHRIVAVVMKADFDPFSQNIALLGWGAQVDGKVTPIGTLVDPLPVTTAQAAPSVTPQQKKATTAAKTIAHGSSHWKRDVVIVLALLGAAFVALRRRGQLGMARPADAVSADPWARVTAVVTPDAPPGPPEPFDQDAAWGAGGSSTVRVRPSGAVPVDPSRLPRRPVD